MILATGGLAMGATSTRSRSSSRAMARASGSGLMPICWASGPTRRTSRARMRSLIRGSFVVGAAMTAHSCAMGTTPQNSKRTSAEADVRRPTLEASVPSIDPTHLRWPGGDHGGPRFHSVVGVRVAHVSSLWTPGGEHRVPDDEGTSASGGGDPGGRSARDPDEDVDDEPLDDVEEAVRSELAEARRRLAEVPAAQVVANHAMGLFELAAIHLGLDNPALDEARLAIDAMAALVDGLGDRLGSSAPVLRDALAQIRMAFVQVTNRGSG